MDLEIINRLYLELSQVATVKTAKEIALEDKLELCRVFVAEVRGADYFCHWDGDRLCKQAEALFKSVFDKGFSGEMSTLAAQRVIDSLSKSAGLEPCETELNAWTAKIAGKLGISGGSDGLFKSWPVARAEIEKELDKLPEVMAAIKSLK